MCYVKSTYIQEISSYSSELLLFIRKLFSALFPIKFDAVLKDTLKLRHLSVLTYLTQLYYRQAKTNCPFMLIKETDFSFPVLSTCG